MGGQVRKSPSWTIYTESVAGLSFSAEYGEMLVLLRKARKAARLTQVDVALALARTQSFVSKIERWEIRLDPIELQRFGRTLPGGGHGPSPAEEGVERGGGIMRVPGRPVPLGGGWHNGWHLRRKSRQKPAEG
jgi:hypothetical protein